MSSFAVRMALALAFMMPMLAGAEERPARWPQFHGPDGAGIAESKEGSPVEFGPEKGLLWKTSLPPGHSSPIIWGDRLFLTGFDPEEKRLETLCLDRATGRVLWRRAVPTKDIEPVYEISSPAASTPVTDGKAVFVYFGSYGLVAYDFEGRELWTRPLPMVQTFRKLGSGTSPIIAGDRLLLDVHLGEASYLLALRAATGETVWQAPKPEFNGGWSTPVVWREGEDNVVGVFNPGRLTAYSLRDGSERWWVNDLPRQACATPLVGDGILFLSATGGQGERDGITLPPSFDEMLGRYDQDKNGRIETAEIPETLLFSNRGANKGAGDLTLRRLLAFFSEGKTPVTSYDRDQWDAVVKGTTEFVQGPYMVSGVFAVRVGGKGDVTRSHVVWTEPRGVPEVPSPLLYKDRLYFVKNGGIVFSREATTGKAVFQGRLGVPGGYYASLVESGGRIYAASDRGAVVVFEAGDDLRVLARNELMDPIYATPAIVEGKLYVRTLSTLYAFGSRPSSSLK
jgi:outer membrane protein assembly factor BamB